jgi:thiamine-phosphate pyrophosphorylase
MRLPTVYPIVDFSFFRAKPDPLAAMVEFAEQLLAGGATILQYRDKISGARTFLVNASELRRVTAGKAVFIVNDRTDIALACDADGVHLGQDDLSPEAARRILDSASHPSSQSLENLQLPRVRVGHPEQSPFEKRILGFSTHNLAQVRQADAWPVDYIAVGPVFATASKANPDPVIGLEGVRAARAATSKPLVAIGGITRENCLQVRRAGADSVAVISDLFESPAKAIEAFLRILG